MVLSFGGRSWRWFSFCGGCQHYWLQLEVLGVAVTSLIPFLTTFPGASSLSNIPSTRGYSCCAKGTPWSGHDSFKDAEECQSSEVLAFSNGLLILSIMWSNYDNDCSGLKKFQKWSFFMTCLVA